MEQFERIPKHETMNDEAIAIADIFLFSLLRLTFFDFEQLGVLGAACDELAADDGAPFCFVSKQRMSVRR
jgi:hypothetical protein